MNRRPGPLRTLIVAATAAGAVTTAHGAMAKQIEPTLIATPTIDETDIRPVAKIDERLIGAPNLQDFAPYYPDEVEGVSVVARPYRDIKAEIRGGIAYIAGIIPYADQAIKLPGAALRGTLVGSFAKGFDLTTEQQNLDKLEMKDRFSHAAATMEAAQTVTGVAAAPIKTVLKWRKASGRKQTLDAVATLVNGADAQADATHHELLQTRGGNRPVTAVQTFARNMETVTEDPGTAIKMVPGIIKEKVTKEINGAKTDVQETLSSFRPAAITVTSRPGSPEPVAVALTVGPK